MGVGVGDMAWLVGGLVIVIGAIRMIMELSLVMEEDLMMSGVVKD